MNRMLIVALAVLSIPLIATGLASAPPQVAASLPYVNLQSATPGIQQTGHLDISGTGLFGAKVGIGTLAPSYPLDVNGTARVLGLQMPTGASDGKVLTSDAAGNASWASAATTFDVPFQATKATAQNLFDLTNNGAGSAGVFRLNNATGNSALIASHTGNGDALHATHSGAGSAVTGVNSGTGTAGLFQATNPASAADAVMVSQSGTGVALHSKNLGTGYAGLFEVNNAGGNAHVIRATTNGLGYGVYASSCTNYAGYFEATDPNANTGGLYATSNGTGDGVTGFSSAMGRGGLFQVNNATNPSPALEALTNGAGPAASFHHDNANVNGSAVKARVAGGGVAIDADGGNAGSAGSFLNGGGSTNMNDALYARSNCAGRAGYFVSYGSWSRPSVQADSSGGGYAVKGLNSADGGAGWFEVSTSGANGADALFATTNQLGHAAHFSVTNPASAVEALLAETPGPGTAVSGYASGTAGAAYGGFFHAKSSSGYGAKGLESSPTGTTFGLFGESASTTGIGLQGLASNPSGSTIGGMFLSLSPAGIGAKGLASAPSGSTYGLWGECASPAGYGVYGKGGLYGGYFATSAVAGTGVYGLSTVASGSPSYGGYFAASNSSGYGVYGINTGASAGAGAGIYGKNATSTNYGFLGGFFYGVYAENDAPGGIAFKSLAPGGSGGMGALLVSAYDGLVSSAGHIGVYVPPGSATAAGWFSGMLYADFASGGIKAFRIDHPLDPANKYLQHSSVESPDMKDIYDGIVTLDGKGEAWIRLPDYFTALNKDYRYQLTCIGQPALVYVKSEIANNRFEVAGGKPGMRVSWQVTGIRQDPMANHRRIQVELDKPAEERGRYLDPEAYGQPQSMRVNYRPIQQLGGRATGSSAPRP